MVHIHLAASSSSVGVSKGFVYLLLEVTIQHAYVFNVYLVTIKMNSSFLIDLLSSHYELNDFFLLEV